MQRTRRLALVLTALGGLVALVAATGATGRSQTAPENVDPPVIASPYLVTVGTSLAGNPGKWKGTDPIKCLIGLGESGDENPTPCFIVGVQDGEIGCCCLTPCRCLDHRFETGAIDVDEGCTRINIRIGHLGAGGIDHGIATRSEFGELIFGRVVEQ